jgi:hypothetical protein
MADGTASQGPRNDAGHCGVPLISTWSATVSREKAPLATSQRWTKKSPVQAIVNSDAWLDLSLVVHVSQREK